jgi:hypothetical protein
MNERLKSLSGAKAPILIAFWTARLMPRPFKNDLISQGRFHLQCRFNLKAELTFKADLIF